MHFSINQCWKINPHLLEFLFSFQDANEHKTSGTFLENPISAELLASPVTLQTVIVFIAFFPCFFFYMYFLFSFD